MSIHKRIQTLTNFILQLEQHNHIPEIKKQIETLKTALKTLKAFSNDKQVLKTTLLVMKQTNELIKKYGVRSNTEIDNIKEEQKKKKANNAMFYFKRVVDEEEIINEPTQQSFPVQNLEYIEYNDEIENNELRDEEYNDVQIENEDSRYDGGIDGGLEDGGVIERNANGIGGCGGKCHPNDYIENFLTNESSKNIQKKFTTSDLQSLPDNAILALNEILNNFRKARDAKNKQREN